MLTNMQFILQAAQKGPKVVTPTGKEVVYNFLEEIPECKDQYCWLCGGETNGRGTPKNKTIKDTFTNHDVSKEPSSSSICEACTWGLSRKELRNYALLATEEGLFHPSKLQIRDFILQKAPLLPFLLVIPTSGQKWLHIFAKVNYSRDKFTVMHEQTPVTIQPVLFQVVLELIEELYTGGFTKAEISSGNYQINRIQKFGLEKFQELDEKLESFRGSRLFNLAIDLARKEE